MLIIIGVFEFDLKVAVNGFEDAVKVILKVAIGLFSTVQHSDLA